MRAKHRRRWHGWALSALPVAMLGGCTVGPDFTPPAAPDVGAYSETPVAPPTPGGQEVAQRFVAGTPPDDWWTLFRSRPLDRVVAHAIASNRTLAAAEATLAQAQHAVAQAGGALYPQVALSANAAREKFNLTSQGVTEPATYFNIFSLGPQVSFALDPFGGNRRRVEQQEALADVRNYQLRAAYLTLTGQVATQMVSAAAAHDELRALQDIIADDERNLDMVRTESRAGELTRIDVQTASSQLEADRTLQPPLQQELTMAEDALAVLVGEGPGRWRPPELSLDDLTLPTELPVSMPSALVHERPDILASESQLHAASAAIGVATAQLYPNLTLSASMEQESLTVAHLFSAASNIWQIAGGLTAPIFEGGALEAQKEGAVSAFDAALATYEQTVLQSFGQVADVLHSLQHDAELLRGQQRSMRAAAEALRLMRMTFAYGAVSLLQILDAERQYAQARLGYVRTKAQRYRDTIQLFVAMGGGTAKLAARNGAAK